MKNLKDFKLNINPFRTIPSINSCEVVWAGFHVIKQKIESQIKRIISLENSGLVLNWGEYGSGKTHSARYFNKQDVLSELSETSNLPLSFDISFPKGKDPIKEIYNQIIDRLDLDNIRTLCNSRMTVKDVVNHVTDSNLVSNLLRLIFKTEIEDINDNLIKRYLYGGLSKTELKPFATHGVQRDLSSDADYTDFIAGFFSLITYKKLAFSSVVIWIDEFEDISILNTSSITKINNFIRTLIDKTPNNLLLFLNLTQSSMMDVDDLGEYLSPAVRSRIKSRIQFSIPEEEQIKEYLRELLNNSIVRDEVVDNAYYPFNEDLIDTIISKFKSKSLRTYNQIFSNLLELAMCELGKEDDVKIDVQFFNDNIEEISPI